MAERLFSSVLRIFREYEWRSYKKKRRSRLRNMDFTIIGSNCSGAFMYYDLGMKYLTPTVNLSMEMDDFVKMVKNLKEYMNRELKELREDYPCPVGVLGDVKIYFIHYKDFEEGKCKWEERKQRINWDNIFIIGSEKDGCSYETLQAFEQLPYENKVIFTRKAYPEFSSACYIKGFEEKEELGVLINFKQGILRRRYLDDFDYVKFLNDGKYCKNQ